MQRWASLFLYQVKLAYGSCFFRSTSSDLSQRQGQGIERCTGHVIVCLVRLSTQGCTPFMASEASRKAASNASWCQTRLSCEPCRAEGCARPQLLPISDNLRIRRYVPCSMPDCEAESKGAGRGCCSHRPSHLMFAETASVGARFRGMSR